MVAATTFMPLIRLADGYELFVYLSEVRELQQDF
jgi:hypothetical protein